MPADPFGILDLSDHVYRLVTRAALALPLAALCGCHQLATTAHNVQGVQDYKQGQYSSAAARFQKAIANDPTNADSYYNMASTIHRIATEKAKSGSGASASQIRDLRVQAETLYNQCLDHDENHVACHRSLAVLLVQMNRSEKAFTLLKNWALANPQSADARIELARLYEEHGDEDTALRHLHRAMAVDRDNPRSWTAAGHIRENRREFDQAIDNYRRAYELNKFQPGVGDRIAALRQAGGGDTRMVEQQSQRRY